MNSIVTYFRGIIETKKYIKNKLAETLIQETKSMTNDSRQLDSLTR